MLKSSCGLQKKNYDIANEGLKEIKKQKIITVQIAKCHKTIPSIDLALEYLRTLQGQEEKLLKIVDNTRDNLCDYVEPTNF